MQEQATSASVAIVFTALLWLGPFGSVHAADKEPGDKTLVALDSDPDESLKKEVQTIFYKPQSKRTGNMWDTWLYLHNGKYYLYTLGTAGGNWWGNISMACSPDGVHWTEIGRVLAKGPGMWMGTGSTWKSPDYKRDGRFIMNFSEAPMRPQQSIFFAESKDLVHWTRLGSQYEFVQDDRWYEKDGRWDSIWTMPRPGGGLYGYWTATPKKETGGQFGFGESLDGVTWKALPPPKVEGAVAGELGAIEKIGSKYYMMFGQNGSLQGGQMVTLVADQPSGPFHAARKNKVLLSGNTYFSRFLATPDALLVNHHAIARDGQVSFAPLKLAVLDEEGTLRLGWWKGNEKMKHQRIEVKPPAPANPMPAVALIENVLDVDAGVIVEGKLLLPAAGNQPRGLYIECDKDRGAAVLLDCDGIARFGTIQADGSDFTAEKTVNREMPVGSPATFRLLLKGSLMELYLNDILIECYSLPSKASGRIGQVTGGEATALSDLAAWR